MKKKYKNYLLLSLVLISQAHIVFRDSNIKIDWFLFTDTKRFLNFSIFQLCIYIKFIVLSYCIIYNDNINKRIAKYLLILSVLDVFHFFLTSGLGYEIIKIITGVIILYILGKKYKW